MSVVFRGVLIIIVIIISLAGFFYLNCRGASLTKISSWFVLSLAYISPVFDLGFSPFGFTIVPFTTICLFYLIIAYKAFAYIPPNIRMGIYVLFFLYLLSAILSPYPFNSFIASIERISPIAVFIAIWILLKAKKQHTIDTACLVISVYAIIWGLIQQFISRDFTFYFFNRIEDIRIISIFSEPQTAGCGLGMLAIYFFNRYKTIKKKLFLILSILLIITGALTGSKTFLIGALLGITISLYFFNISPKIIFTLALVGLALYFTQEYWLQLPVFERMKEMDDSYDVRSTIFWAAGWEIFVKNWPTGIGIGNFLEYNTNNFRLLYPNGGIATQPESGYLLLLDEMGIMSIYYIIILAYIIIKGGYREYNIGLIIPWLIAFISVYNLESCHIQFILYAFISLILYSSFTEKRTLRKHHLQ